MEFNDRDDHDEDEELDLPPVSYISPATNSAAMKMSSIGGGELVVLKPKPRYRECLKNHAVGIGGHAVDGCGEFLPSGEDGTLDALKCAACNCHRNFHRKEIDGGDSLYRHHAQISPYYRTQAGYFHQNRPLALPMACGGGGSSREDQEDLSNPTGGGGGAGDGGFGGTRKRFRTKFTPEQKEKMLRLAETIGWRFQKQDEAVVQQFCNETGVRRQVLKVWMHNNKHTLGKKP